MEPGTDGAPLIFFLIRTLTTLELRGWSLGLSWGASAFFKSELLPPLISEHGASDCDGAPLIFKSELLPPWNSEDGAWD